jgi:hypothetical protein
MQAKNLIIVLSLACAAPVFAQTGSPPAPNAQQRIDQREANQEKRIEQGEKSGTLTPRESARLERRQARIGAMEQKATTDGTITKKEAGRIQHAQNVESRDIRRQKRDRQHDFNHDGKRDLPGRRS